MGNHCTGAREKANEYKETATIKMENAKVATRDGYEITRMRTQGYKV
jgi:hypothetical protein